MERFIRLIAVLLIPYMVAAAKPPLDQSKLRLVPARMQEYIDRGEIAAS